MVAAHFECSIRPSLVGDVLLMNFSGKTISVHVYIFEHQAARYLTEMKFENQSAIYGELFITCGGKYVVGQTRKNNQK